MEHDLTRGLIAIKSLPQARSHHSNASLMSLESGMRSVMDDAQLEIAMAEIDKAKSRSREQRIRSFCNAACLGSMDILIRLVNSGVDINGADANGRWVPVDTNALAVFPHTE